MDGEIAAALKALEAERTRLDALCAASPTATAAALTTARDRLGEAIAALGDVARRLEEPAPARIADRITLIELPSADTFRTKVKLKVAEPLPQAAPAPTGDDLTRIRGIDAALAARLAGEGITSFAAIAGMGPAQVRTVSQNLDLGRQISRQNWIEQAALLRRPAPPVSNSQPPQPPAPAIETPAADMVATLEPAAAPPPAPDRLDLIAGIDARLADTLLAHGISQWSDIARWRRADIDRARQLLGRRVPIARQGWIEQAAVLAAGRLTHHATRVLAGDFHGLVAPPPPEPLPAPTFVDWQGLLTARTRLAQPAAAPPRPALEPPAAVLLLPAPVISAHALAPPPTFVIALPSEMPSATTAVEPAAGPPAVTEIIQRVDALEQELAALVANDTAAADPVIAPAAPPPAAAEANSGLNIEDEEFPELNVGEADVVIVKSKPVKPAAAQRPVPATGRGLLSRLKRASPLDDIDSSTYAAYRDRVEEASVEIIKPAAPGKS